jgi:hypothetical protein
MVRKLIATLCLTVFLVSSGVCRAADLQKGVDAARKGDFVTWEKTSRAIQSFGRRLYESAR